MVGKWFKLKLSQVSNLMGLQQSQLYFGQYFKLRFLLVIYRVQTKTHTCKHETIWLFYQWFLTLNLCILFIIRNIITRLRKLLSKLPRIQTLGIISPPCGFSMHFPVLTAGFQQRLYLYIYMFYLVCDWDHVFSS